MLFRNNVCNKGSPAIRRRWLVLPVTFLLSLSAFSAHAATYYVATNGSDSNNGSQAAPFKTFERAIAPLKPGDTLYIRGGTYTEQMDFQGPNKSGIASGWITVAGYQGEKVILQTTGDTAYGPIKARGDRGYFLFENLVLDGAYLERGSTWELREGNHDFVIRNIEMKNFYGSPLKVNGTNIKVLNSKFHSTRTGRVYGMYISYGSNIIIEGNEFYNNTGGGIHVFPGPLNNVVIRNNVVHHNNTIANSTVPGIEIFADIDYTKHGSGVIDGVYVYNNIVYSNCLIDPCGGIRVSNGARNVKIWNNTVYGNKGYGIAVGGGDNGPAVNTTVQNNIAFGNTTQQIIDAGSNTTLSNNLTAEPQFVNAAAGDFGVQAGSPAIDKGISLASVPTDFTGKSRPEGAAYDIGAFEGAGSKANAIPSMPGGLPGGVIGGAGGTGGRSDPLGLGNCGRDSAYR